LLAVGHPIDWFMLGRLDLAPERIDRSFGNDQLD